MPVIEQLRKLPDPDAPEFPPRLGDLVSSTDDIRHELEGVLDRPDEDARVRFSAYYGLLVHARRLKDLSLFDEVFHKHWEEFSDRKIALLLRSQYFLNRPDQPGSLICALDFAEKAHEQLPGHYGVDSHLARVITEMEERAAEPDVRRLREALDLIERSISLSAGTYATYYANRGRVLSLLGEYDDAFEALDEAIDREPSTSDSYAVRIADHQIAKMRIEMRRQVLELHNEQRKALASLREIRTEVLTILGLLAAVIAFLVTGVQVGIKGNTKDAAQLFGVLGGVIVFVFACFSILFDPRERRQKFLAAGVGAAIALALALLP